MVASDLDGGRILGRRAANLNERCKSAEVRDDETNREAEELRSNLKSRVNMEGEFVLGCT